MDNVKIEVVSGVEFDRRFSHEHGEKVAKVEVQALLATASDQELLDTLNDRGRQVKWVKRPIPEPSNLGRSFVSPSCDVENWDCTEQDDD